MGRSFKYCHNRALVYPQVEITELEKALLELDKRDEKTYLKTKRGISGFVNGSRKSAIADTGSAKNVISAAYSRSDPNTTKRAPFYAHNNFLTTTPISLY
jgi:hypothetical protein